MTRMWVRAGIVAAAALAASFPLPPERVEAYYSTGAYVYSAPAVGPGPGGTPTVFIGSYDQSFYAFDARSGRVLWAYHSKGRISGAPSLIGHVVYFSSLDSHSTSGLDAATGKRIFKRSTGKFNPMISDGKRMYMTGFSTIYTMVPK